MFCAQVLMPMYLSDAGANSSVYTMCEVILIICWLLSVGGIEQFVPDP